MDPSFRIAGKHIEAAWHGPRPESAPTLVLLHEGLGSVAMWKEFPQTLAERTGYGVLVYSRPGYGNSDPVALPRPLAYMHEEARAILPAVLDQAGRQACARGKCYAAGARPSCSARTRATNSPIAASVSSGRST